MTLGQDDLYTGWEPSPDPYSDWEPSPDAGSYGDLDYGVGAPAGAWEGVTQITLPDIVAREFANQPTGFEVTYEGETWVETPSFDEAVEVAWNYSNLDLPYASAPSSMNTAAAEYVQTVQAGGSTQGWADRWLPQIGQALVNALPSLLNRVAGNPQTGRYAVQTQRAGLGAIPWTPILIGVAALFVLPKLMRGGSRGGRRTRARRR